MHQWRVRMVRLTAFLPEKFLVATIKYRTTSRSSEQIADERLIEIVDLALGMWAWFPSGPHGMAYMAKS